MAVTVKEKKDDKLILEIDNGDFTKLEELMNKWNFVDYQSFLRFAVSIMLVTQEKFLAIKIDEKITPIAPTEDFIKSKE